MLNFDVPTVHFFKANPDFPPETVAKSLKMALERVLVHYDFLAGRFKLNLQSGRLEIDCNSAGMGFVVATSECLLDELGDFAYPNLGFRQLAIRTLDNLGPELTSFKCGGFSIGLSTNHVLLDGVSAQNFIENLATQAFDDKPLAIFPCNDRHLLAARSPPHVEFPHPEFFKPDLPAGQARESIGSTTTKITVLSVVAALIWRCKALANYTEYNKDRVSTLLNVVDLRSRLNPPLPNSYCGNAVLVAYSSATCEDIEQWPFSKLVEMVAEAPKRLTDEYAKSVIDWLEINKGLPCGEYMVSSWLRMRFGEVVYPWGKPVHSGPVVSHRKDICWIFPGVDGANALVSLPAKEMERFVACFREFFPKSIIN
ncbi:UNVERIFIED_CONTAM: Shikimate O-hydroxycinnamoyltransferase [Sesamum calycinum]|uniref:Shikimate O-hydroxycinnamoyltransferase n=1 Tax=Sesamum calycinum TaxID=2727403 RepID=A0AAW2IZ52_9LAMI